MRILLHHSELNEMGEGKCSVPMWQWQTECFCDEPAYGTPIPYTYYVNARTGERFRTDGGYTGYVPALACPAHGGPKTRVFRDGNAWCAVHPDFINLQESPAGFGETPKMAREQLLGSKGVHKL